MVENMGIWYHEVIMLSCTGVILVLQGQHHHQAGGEGGERVRVTAVMEHTCRRVGWMGGGVPSSQINLQIFYNGCI